MSTEPRIVTRIIEEEMKTAYIDYSMSVIVSRALPDVRDGLKPVHRRVLYGMTDLGLASNRPFKKSARIVGEVLGKYHPHGDSAVYETMVRMGQDWVMRYLLVDKQGNFGSIDDSTPAAMRYTEARLKRFAEEMLKDLDKETVDFQNNFDDSLKEPTVLPSAVPNLLVNGSSGIAVGMATNMPPHNLREVIDAIVAYIENPEIEIPELLRYIQGPDFPTGGMIYGLEGIREAFATGRGKINVRARAEIEIDKQDREQIIITEVPYQSNIPSILEKIATLVTEKRLEGISDVRDESTKTVRIVVDVRKDANAQVVLNKLYQLTPLQTSFSVNNIALVNGRPQTLNLKDLIRHYVNHRHEVVTRRTQYDLSEARKRAHILEGILIALDHLDEVIALIRASRTVDEAQEGLILRFALSEIQAKAILDMRLQRLTGLEREKVQQQYQELMDKIEYYERVLADKGLRMKIVTDELLEVREAYGDDRRTTIVPEENEIRLEDLVANEDMIITITHQGYIKRTPASDYRVQGRGGKGARGTGKKEEDFIEHLFSAKTHNDMLFFTRKGKCYRLKVYQIPVGERTGKGRALQNLIQIDSDDKVKAYVNIESLEDGNFLKNHFIIFATKKGIIKKTSLEAFGKPRNTGIIAITINEGDELLEVRLSDASCHVVMAVKSGYAIRFEENKVREMGRTAAGVIGISLTGDEDEVVGMVVVKSEDETLLVVSEYGYGKQTPVSEYRITNRGGKGIKTINVSEKTGNLVAIKQVEGREDLMIMTREGLSIRLNTSDISTQGRNTQGVRLIRLNKADMIASVAKVVESDEEPNSESQ